VVSVHPPVRTLIVVPTRSNPDRRFHTARRARFEASKYFRSPVCSDRYPNSVMLLPTSASGVWLPLTAPVRRLT
jgi:hypothetical protein